MALLTVSKELTLTEAGNSAFISNVFHGLVGNIVCLCMYVHTTFLGILRIHSYCSTLALAQ